MPDDTTPNPTPPGNNIVPLVNPAGQPLRRFSAEFVARSAVVGKRPVMSPFTVPSFPPMVERAVKDAGIATIAMDEFIGSNFAWGSTDTIANAYAEGIVFLGYSYLATLAQRAEYRVVTETIAAEMTREWIELKVAAEDEHSDVKKQIEDELDRLNVRHAFRKAAESDGFFGRGHLYLDTGMTDDADELLTDIGDGRNMMSKLKIGPEKSQKLIGVRPVEASWCYPTHYESVDPLKRDWYAPVTWYVMSREVHRSRLMTFIGREVPDILKPAYAFGGLSMSQMLKPYVDNWLRTRQSVSDLIQNFSFMVLKTNMDASTGVGGEQILQRVAVFNNVKNNQGCLTGDTLVTTNRGDIPIRDVNVTDKVLTRNGFAPLVWAGQTKYTNRVVELATDTGAVIQATACHPIYLSKTNEFVPAGNVKVGDYLLADQTKDASRSLGVAIGTALRKRAITKITKATDYCTALFGERIAAPFQRVMSSIIKMETVPTINSTTWNLRPELSTPLSTATLQWKEKNARSAANITIAHNRNLSIAPHLVIKRRAVVEEAYDRSTSTIPEIVANAVSNLKCLLAKVKREYSAAVSAPVSTAITSVKRVSYKRLQKSVPVYNLEVADGYLPEYFANGVLVHNCVVLDKDTEDWANVSAPIGGLDHLQAQAQEHLASISRIPLVKLLGIQPAGLNASSEGELVAFEDWIAAFQEAMFRKPLTTIIDFIQLSLFGEINHDITFEFKPLRQLNPTEQAALEATIAQTREIYMQGGSVDAEEVREALANDPNTPFNGIDLDKPLPPPPAGGMPGMPPMPGAGGPPGGAPPNGAGPRPPPPGGPPKAPAPPALPPRDSAPPTDAQPDTQPSARPRFEIRQAAADAKFARRMALDASTFKEEDVKRDDGGKFSKQSGSGGGTSSETKSKEEEAPQPYIVETKRGVFALREKGFMQDVPGNPNIFHHPGNKNWAEKNNDKPRYTIEKDKNGKVFKLTDHDTDEVNESLTSEQLYNKIVEKRISRSDTQKELKTKVSNKSHKPSDQSKSPLSSHNERLGPDQQKSLRDYGFKEEGSVSEKIPVMGDDYHRLKVFKNEAGDTIKIHPGSSDSDSYWKLELADGTTSAGRGTKWQDKLNDATPQALHIKVPGRGDVPLRTLGFMKTTRGGNSFKHADGHKIDVQDDGKFKFTDGDTGKVTSDLSGKELLDVVKDKNITKPPKDKDTGTNTKEPEPPKQETNKEKQDEPDKPSNKISSEQAKILEDFGWESTGKTTTIKNVRGDDAEYAVLKNKAGDTINVEQGAATPHWQLELADGTNHEGYGSSWRHKLTADARKAGEEKIKQELDNRIKKEYETAKKRHPEMMKTVDRIADKHDYPKELITVKHAKKQFTFRIGGRKSTAHGLAYPDGRIVINSIANKDQLDGLLAHEIFHQKQNQALRTDPNIQSMINLNFDELQKTDGVTEYSKMWWKTYEDRKDSLSKRSAINETLAEMANKIEQLTETNNYIKFDPIWEHLYNTINETYAKTPRKELRAWSEPHKAAA